MNKKFILLTTVLSVISSLSFGQQDKLITHFIYDKMSINPGETGIDDGICATSIYRDQWDKVNGAPNSAVLNIEANMNPKIIIRYLIFFNLLVHFHFFKNFFQSFSFSS